MQAAKYPQSHLVIVKDISRTVICSGSITFAQKAASLNIEVSPLMPGQATEI